MSEPAAGPARQYVTFVVDERAFGIDILSVLEIRRWSPVTPLPNQAAHTRGVLNLRGAVAPVHDLRARFGGGLTAATDAHIVVIVDIEGRRVGILVDAVRDIVSVAEADLRPAPGAEAGGAVAALAAIGEEMVAILDPAALFGPGAGAGAAA